MFEGDKLREEQQKRIEEDMHESRVPVSDLADDKESAIHVEDSKI